MMWIPITLAAATFQILRTSRQHQLREWLSTNAAGFVRFAYGGPMAVAVALVLFVVLGHDVPDIPGRFWVIIVTAGVAQILATVALLASFKTRDFAIGTVYSKAEVLFVAALGGLGVGTAIEAPGWIGVVMVTAGIALLAAKGSLVSLLRRAGDPAALLGLLAGAGFGVAAIGIRAASQKLGDAPAFDRAVLTLAALLVIQTAVNTAWFLARDPEEIGRVLGAWRAATVVGALSVCGSLGWAWAFSLEGAAKVRTLGQVELIVAFVVARITLDERHTRADYVASALVLLGVVVVTVLG